MNRGGTLGPREIGENNGARTNEGRGGGGGGKAGAMKEVHKIVYEKYRRFLLFFFSSSSLFFFLPFLFLSHGFLQREGRRI